MQNNEINKIKKISGQGEQGKRKLRVWEGQIKSKIRLVHNTCAVRPCTFTGDRERVGKTMQSRITALGRIDTGTDFRIFNVAF